MQALPSFIAVDEVLVKQHVQLPGAAVTAQTGHGGTWEVEAGSLVLKVILSYIDQPELHETIFQKE